MKNPFRTFLVFLARTNLFISFGSLFSILGAAAFTGIGLDYQLASFSFFAALFTYNFQRRVGDLNQDQSFLKIGSAMMIFGLLGMGIFALKLSIIQLVVLSMTGMISLAYAYPFIPTHRGKISLRMVPGLKLWTIVLVWTISCVALPVIGSELDAELIVLFTFQQAFFVTALTIPFDIRDLPVDWPEQRTIPQVFGVRKARNLAFVSLLFSSISSVSLFLLREIDLRLIMIHLGVLLLSGALISRTQTKSGELYFSIGIDGMLILQGVLFVLAKQYI